MSTDTTFRVLIQRVRAGDAAAAAELVRDFEPAIRRMIRVYLTDRRLRRVFDSMDLCQSVLANFFVRVAAGQFDVDQPEKLLKLLTEMARNKVREVARRQHARRRDNRRVEPDGEEALKAVPDPTDTPSQIVAAKELWQQVRQRLTVEERALAEQRAQGSAWEEIAAEQGDSAEALRKKLARAINRVLRVLGLEEDNHV